jgi:hypothetical protein
MFGKTSHEPSIYSYRVPHYDGFTYGIAQNFFLIPGGCTTIRYRGRSFESYRLKSIVE